MLKAFLLIIVILTPSGEMQMSTQFVDSCPDKEVVSGVLDQMKSEGKIIGWVGRCMPADNSSGTGL